MIKTFKDKETGKYITVYIQRSYLKRIAMKKLRMLDAAPDTNSLRAPPGNRLELLLGDRG